MGFFSKAEDEIRYGIIVDVGSGSVLAAIVESDKDQMSPKIIWSKREFIPLRQVNSLNQTVKSIMATLVSVLMMVDSEGRKKLREHASGSKISTLQVTMAAPWSFTVTKTISYKNDKKFTISEHFLTDLLSMARQKVLEELKENENVQELGLEIVSRITTDVVANGYSIKVTGKQTADAIKVVELSNITYKVLSDEVREIQAKMFRTTNLRQYSFMTPFFYTIVDLYPDAMESCLVDVTYEAVEIGVVRNGTLQYCTHTPYGIISLAREIAATLSVTLEEAKNYLIEPDLKIILNKYSDKQKEEIKTIFEAYKNRLMDLFKETGDKLSIPKTIFIHTDSLFAPFFKQQIVEALKTITKSSHMVYNVTGELITKYYSEDQQVLIKDQKQDTAMLISAQFFHTHPNDEQFEQL